MAFKEMLLRKINYDKMKKKVLRAAGDTTGNLRIDLSVMKALLDDAGYHHQKVRDLDIFLEKELSDDEKGMMLVLDNELKIYNTTLSDVLIRKSPTVKEMISFRNAVKILNDNDIVVSKKKETIEQVYDKLIGTLDLSYGPSDIDRIALEGRAGLDGNDDDGVLEALSLFEALLSYGPLPAAFSFSNCYLRGKLKESHGIKSAGPVFIYHQADNKLKLIEAKRALDDETRFLLEKLIKGEEQADYSGHDVFLFLKNSVKPFES